MEDIKTRIKSHFERDCKLFAAIDDMHVCSYFASVVRTAVKNKLKEAGFKEIGKYFSHRHKTTVFMMQRITTAKEWKNHTLYFKMPPPHPKQR